MIKAGRLTIHLLLNQINAMLLL